MSKKIPVKDITNEDLENITNLKDLRMNLDQIKELFSKTFDMNMDDIESLGELREQITEQDIIDSYKKKKEEEQSQEVHCYNVVCESHVRHEFMEEVQDDDGMISTKFSGRENYCSGNSERDCLYCMTTPPPSSISYSPDFLPSHQEAINLLIALNVIGSDDFGHWKGTDFAFHENTHKLWFSFTEVIASLFDLDYNEPVEKSNAIEISKYYFEMKNGIFTSSSWKQLENDIRSQLEYFLMSRTAEDVLKSPEELNYTKDYFYNKIKGLVMGAYEKGKLDAKKDNEDDKS